MMARYPLGPYARRRNRSRNWLYIILILVIAGGVIAVIFDINPFKKQTAADKALDIKDESKLPQSSDIGKKPIEEESVPKPEPTIVEKEPNLTAIPQASVETDPRAVELISKAMECLNEKPANTIEARNKLNEALALTMSTEQQKLVKKQLAALAEEWLFSRKIFPEDPLCGSYKVKPGEIPSTIANQYKIPYELLLRINNIPNAEALRADETIKVIKGPFHATIHRSTFTIDIFLQNTFVKSFDVGLGQSGMETPIGLWQVKKDGKSIKPQWRHPETNQIITADHPDYELGSRWIGLEGIDESTKGRIGFGIHGTKKPETIGMASSRGCIRLHNGDVIEVYDLLVPVYSKVKVVD